MSAGSATALASPQPACAKCGAQAPTKAVTFYQNIGMVFMRKTATASGNMCRRCIRAYFKSFTLTTLFLGWWGFISFIITPFILLNNVWRFLSSLSLPEPSPMANTPTAAPNISVGVGSPSFKLIYGAIVCIGVLGFLAYNNVSFIEKHAPSLNAKLHDGEITDGADAKYAGSRIGTDILALNAEVKAQNTWAAWRVEYLSRESTFNDLVMQNDKLQRALAQERLQNAASNDPCEQIALSQFGPALNDYTHTVAQIFSFVKDKTTLTKADNAVLDGLLAQQDDPLKRIAASNSAGDAKGCK
jgi:hypothetical protein